MADGKIDISLVNAILTYTQTKKIGEKGDENKIERASWIMRFRTLSLYDIRTSAFSSPPQTGISNYKRAVKGRCRAGSARGV